VLYPEKIDPEEVLVRVIRTPHFYDKGRLKPNALRPQKGTDRVSIVRWLYREQPGKAFKARCHKIGNSGPNKFSGLGVFLASACLETNLVLEDDPTPYAGHANIVYPFVVKDSEPQEGELFARQAEISKKLLASVQYIPDPKPDESEWTIETPLLP